MKLSRILLPVAVVSVIGVAGCGDSNLREFLFDDPNDPKWAAPNRNYSGAYLDWLEAEVNDLYKDVCTLKAEHTGVPNCTTPDPTNPPPWPPR